VMCSSRLVAPMDPVYALAITNLTQSRGGDANQHDRRALPIRYGRNVQDIQTCLHHTREAVVSPGAFPTKRITAKRGQHTVAHLIPLSIEPRRGSFNPLSRGFNRDSS